MVGSVHFLGAKGALDDRRYDAWESFTDADALWREYGVLPWAQLVEPALRLARDGVELPPAHAVVLEMLAPALTLDVGARIYSPAGRLLRPGERLEQPGLVNALESLAAEGSDGAYSGTIGRALLELAVERGALLTTDDLEAYEPLWTEPVELTRLGLCWLTRASSSRAPSRRGGWSRSSSSLITRGSWPASSTRSSSRGRPGRHRSSVSSSAPP